MNCNGLYEKINVNDLSDKKEIQTVSNKEKRKHIPLKERLKDYDGQYEFVECDTGEPTGNEIIK